jgi:hypothetical protein
MDPREQAPQAVADAGGLPGQVVVEADGHLQLGDGLVSELDRAEGVRHDAGRVGDDERVAGVAPGLTGTGIGGPPHRESGQIGDRAAHVPRDRRRQGADGRRLVDHDEHAPVLGPQFSKTSRSFGSLLGSRLSKAFYPAGVTAVAWCSPLPTSRPGKTPMSLTSITCFLRLSPPGRPTAPIATSP